MKARQIESRTQAENRSADLGAHIRAIRGEQGKLISELVWSEMRAWEIQGRLGQALEADERHSLEREYERRLRLISSMAKWEESADHTLTRLRDELTGLLASFPGIGDDSLAALSLERGLEPIARAAAADLGLG